MDGNNTNIQASQASNAVTLQETQDEAVGNTSCVFFEVQNICHESNVPVELFLICGQSYQREGKNEEAIKSYEQAIEAASETNRNDIKAKTYQHLGNVYTGNSEHGKAMEYYRKARDISPDFEIDQMERISYQWLLNRQESQTFSKKEIDTGNYNNYIFYFEKHNVHFLTKLLINKPQGDVLHNLSQYCTNKII